MDRRMFGAGLVAGMIGLGATGASAQRGRRGNMAMGAAEQRHGIETLGIGNVALLTSRLALNRGNHPLVRQFAQFETEEQTTVAQIIREMSGLIPPPPAPADRRVIERLERLSGPAFDREYLVGQIDGHRRLLAVQDTYLASGRNMHQRHIAMLARGRINEHIRELDLIRQARG